MIENELDNLMSITTLAEKYHLTRQAIFKAMQKGDLTGHRIGREWCICEKEYMQYRSQKYNRMKSKFNGMPLYSSTEKEISPRQCAKLFGFPEQHIYYLIRSGWLPCEKRGAALVLKYDECMRILGENENQMRFV